jgi:uncharacterized protein (TIGR03086 family)
LVQPASHPHDLLAVHATAVAGFGSRLARVGDGDWERPTPCTEWDVWALVNHVVGANVRYQLILAGAPLAEVEATRPRDHLGAAPADAFESTAAVTMRAFDDPAVMAATFHHAVGERTGEQLLLMRIYDIGVHTWDLAVAIDGDRELDATVVDVALTSTTANAGERDDLTTQDRLLVRSGRQPNQEAKR